MWVPQVLNLGHNALSGRLTLNGLPSLRALMLNDNQLTGIEGSLHTLMKLDLCPSLVHKLPSEILAWVICKTAQHACILCLGSLLLCPGQSAT